ncbi:MAG: long-chain fatty acid--CoA ligase [Nevskia sp.]|nr:long-chain fatty acid--CoA ligase [Nevskia sp.]
MNLAHLLERSARIYPDNPAVFLGERLICDYRGLGERAARIAGFLTGRLGLRPGDRVGLFMTNVAEYLELLYGTFHAGMVAVPINAKLHPREVEYILENSEASALFVSADLAEGLQPLLGGLKNLRAALRPGTPEYAEVYGAAPMAVVHREPDDIAWLFYTSGTTGRPKGVMLTHRNLMTMVSCHCIDVDAPRMEDCALYAAPMSHAAGMGNFPHMIAAARHVITTSGSFDPEEVLSLARYHGGAFMFGAPTMVKRLADHVEATGADPSGLRSVLYGGGPMYIEDIKQALRVMGQRFVQIFGQGESPMTITVLSRRHLGDTGHPRYEQRIASVGVAQSLVEVRVADEDGRTLPVGEIGEVLVRGDTVMKGYWRNPEATAKAIRGGWLFTGDMGCMDADGFLTLKDRSKDMIISGGSNIYPREVEEVLLQHPDVLEVSVVGRRHEEWGEEVVAFVVARSGGRLRTEELDELCLRNIARFKRPRQYRQVAALPKSNYGKILKTRLREMLAEEESAAGA